MTPRRTLIVIVLLLLISSLLPTSVAARIGSWPKTVVDILLAPVTMVLHQAGTSIRPAEQRTVELAAEGNLRQQYEQALWYVRQLEQQNHELRRDLQRFTQSAAVMDLSAIRFETASVTASLSDRLAPRLRLDVGANEGVEPGQAVVSGFELVGEIVDVTPMTSDVALVTGIDQSLAVRIVPPTDLAAPRELRVRIEPVAGEAAFYADVDLDHPVQVDDMASLVDELWPPSARGSFVGMVTRIEEHPTQPLLRKRLIVEPMIDLTRLRKVDVLVPVETRS